MVMFHRNAPDSVNDAVDMTVLSGLQDAQAEGEPDLIVELIDLYLDDTPRRLDAMTALLENRDMLSLRRAAHSLKGSSATLGAGRTAQLCEAIEELTQDNSLDAFAELLHRLELEFARVRQSFLIERRRRTSQALGLPANPSPNPRTNTKCW